MTDLLRSTAGRPRLIVSRAALRHNRRHLRQAAGAGVKLCPVVKANAYGHGAAAVADALVHDFADTTSAAPGVDALAVATLGEALDLPDLEVPTMVLRPVECLYLGQTRQELEAALRRGIVLSLATPAGASDVARVAERLGVRANVQIMLDTGMGREMCEPAHFAATVEAVLKYPALRLRGLGTHFTDGEMDDEPYSDDQVRLFHDAVAPLAGRLPTNVLRHAANSGGTLGGHGLDDFDMIRPGISTYGIHPSCQASDGGELRPIARWTAPLLMVRTIPAGGSVGYNRLWRAEKPTRIGTIPVGYADGYRRLLTGRSVVRVPGAEGRPDAFCEVVGRVSMDYITIDLTPAPWAMPGDEVTLLDDEPASPCSAYALADRCGTIPYEIFCGIGPRVARVMV